MSRIICGTETPEYIELRKNMSGRFNGAYYYAKEFEDNIIPKVKTTRPWVLINMKDFCEDHAIVLIHDNHNPRGTYAWLRDYQDLIFICSTPTTFHDMQREKNGMAIYLPMSVDVDKVLSYAEGYNEIEEPTAYYGNRWGIYKDELNVMLPEDCHIIDGVERSEALRDLSHYKTVWAIGRCAIEAKILGCDVKEIPYRYFKGPATDILDNRFAWNNLNEQIGDK
jgi:hypothetical protein